MKKVIINFFVVVAIILITTLNYGCKKKDDTSNEIIIRPAIAYYSLNGNAIDEAGTNSGVLIGTTPTTNRHGDNSSALLFNGTTDYVSIPHNQLMNFNYDQDFTISIWVEPEEIQLDLNGQSNAILCKWDDLGTSCYPYHLRYFNQLINPSF